MTTVLPGTCSACSFYTSQETCTCASSPFQDRHLWRLACVPCRTYKRGTLAATPVDPLALAAVVSGDKRR